MAASFTEKIKNTNSPIKTSSVRVSIKFIHTNWMLPYRTLFTQYFQVFILLKISDIIGFLFVYNKDIVRFFLALYLNIYEYLL